MEGVIEQFGVDWKLVLAETVNFLLVLFVLYYFVFRKISSLLDERQSTIQKGVENAEQAQEKLKEAEAEKKDILHKAGEQATAEIKSAIETAKIREAEIVDNANQRSDQILADAEKKGESLKEKLVESSKEDIARMVVLGAEKTLNKG